MTLAEAKELLTNNKIPFTQVEYDNETLFFKHLKTTTEKSRSFKVIALVIKSNNGKKDLELQFNVIDENDIFQDLWFGAYWYELFDCSDEILANELLNTIVGVMNGTESIILIYNSKYDCCLGSLHFDRSNDGAIFDSSGFNKAVKKIEKKKSLVSKLLNYKRQYEIYDWNTYRHVIK